MGALRATAWAGGARLAVTELGTQLAVRGGVVRLVGARGARACAPRAALMRCKGAIASKHARRARSRKVLVMAAQRQDVDGLAEQAWILPPIARLVYCGKLAVGVARIAQASVDIAFGVL